MDILGGQTAVTALAALPAPVATPSLNERLQREAIAIREGELAEALAAGARSVPEDALDDQVKPAIDLALGFLDSRPQGVGAALFAAQVAGIVTAVAAARSGNPDLLAYAKRLRRGSDVLDGAAGGSFLPLAMAAGEALEELARDPEPKLRPAVLGAATALAELPPEPAP